VPEGGVCPLEQETAQEREFVTPTKRFTLK